MSVYRPVPGLNPYLPRAILFHLARDWTTSTSNSLIPFSVNLTVRSTPLRLSFNPVLGSTNSGAEIRTRFMFSSNAFIKNSLMSLMQTWVSIRLIFGSYPSGMIRSPSILIMRYTPCFKKTYPLFYRNRSLHVNLFEHIGGVL